MSDQLQLNLQLNMDNLLYVYIYINIGRYRAARTAYSISHEFGTVAVGLMDHLDIVNDFCKIYWHPA